MTNPTTDLAPSQAPENLPEVPKFDTRVDPQSLAELFSRDPEKLSEQDIQIIVTELRAKRAIFAQEEETKALKPKRAKAIPGPKIPADQLSLDALGL